jgi:hypothetical protein
MWACWTEQADRAGSPVRPDERVVPDDTQSEARSRPASENTQLNLRLDAHYQ